MKKAILFGLMTLMTNYIFAQWPSSTFDMYSTTINIDQKAKAFGLSASEFEAIKKQAYANANFIEGNVYTDEEPMLKAIPMRYNAAADEIEIKNSSSSDYGALSKDPSIYAKISKDIYVFIPYNGSNEKGGYFNILTEGKHYNLYKKTKATFHEGREAKTSYDSKKPSYFSKDVTYYLVKDGKFYELPSRKSRILKVMDKKKKEVRSYIKDNRLDLNEEADLTKLVTYYDSLL